MPHTPTRPYARFADGVEQEHPNEQQLIGETVASVARVNRFVLERNRHAIRGARAKGRGVPRLPSAPGAINRVRTKAYERPTAYRQHMNAQPRVEPRGINQLPD